MSVTRLSDVIVPEVYQGYMTLENTKANRFLVSGVVAQDPVLDARAAGPSQVTNVPFWNQIDHDSRPDLSNDNPADKAIPDKIDTGLQVAHTAYLHKSWSAMNLVKYLAGADPMMAIQTMTNDYWSTAFQTRLISTAMGIYADNVASNSSDMVWDVAATSGTATTANMIGSASVIEAELTLGDAMGGIIAMAVHSRVFGMMKKLDLIDYVLPSSGSGLVSQTPQGNPMYQGKQLFVDDALPAVSDGHGNVVYTSILFGPGAFGFGLGNPDTPVEVTRDATAGNGSGQDVLHERRHYLLHPFGFAFNTGVIPSGQQSADLEQLESASGWSRVVPRKLIPMAFLRTNG